MDPAAKQQIVERVKQATNILVTVSSNPTVDQLAACIGLTLMLGRMEKHATAVFSGRIPSTIEFLQPEKTIETNTDSLQDFIISLDKNKADKLRYKVEDKVVRIFITPYRTALTEKDLIFGQGDFNVEVVIALGINDRTQLDQAITAHGRILHDATVVSLVAGQGKLLDLGQINWQDPAASSLSEMIVSMSDDFGQGLIDNQIATAFLTGVVASTQRFSNAKTTPQVMTVSAQLIAAGANPQLIATKLEAPAPKTGEAPKPLVPIKPNPKLEAKRKDGELNVSHDKDKKDGAEVEIVPNEIDIDKQGHLKSIDAPPPEAPLPLNFQLEPSVLPPPPAFETPVAPLAAAPTPPPTPPPSAPIPAPQPIAPPTPAPTPVVTAFPTPPPSDMPGPHSLLDPLAHRPSMSAPFTANTEPEWGESYSGGPSNSPDAIGTGAGHEPVIAPPKDPLAAAAPAPQPSPTVDTARNAVDSALASAPFNEDLPPRLVGIGSQPIGDQFHQPEVVQPNGMNDIQPPPFPPPPLMATSAAAPVAAGVNQFPLPPAN